MLPEYLWFVQCVYMNIYVCMQYFKYLIFTEYLDKWESVWKLATFPWQHPWQPYPVSRDYRVAYKFWGRCGSVGFVLYLKGHFQKYLHIYHN